MSFNVQYHYCAGFEVTEVTPEGVTEVILKSDAGKIAVSPNSGRWNTVFGLKGDHLMLVEHGTKQIVLDLTDEAVDQLVDALVLSQQGSLHGKYDPEIDCVLFDQDKDDIEVEPKVVPYIFERSDEDEDGMRPRITIPVRLGEIFDIADKEDLELDDVIEFKYEIG